MSVQNYVIFIQGLSTEQFLKKLFYLGDWVILARNEKRAEYLARLTACPVLTLKKWRKEGYKGKQQVYLDDLQFWLDCLEEHHFGRYYFEWIGLLEANLWGVFQYLSSANQNFLKEYFSPNFEQVYWIKYTRSFSYVYWNQLCLYNSWIPQGMLRRMLFEVQWRDGKSKAVAVFKTPSELQLMRQVLEIRGIKTHNMMSTSEGVQLCLESELDLLEFSSDCDIYLFSRQFSTADWNRMMHQVGPHYRYVHSYLAPGLDRSKSWSKQLKTSLLDLCLRSWL